MLLINLIDYRNVNKDYFSENNINMLKEFINLILLKKFNFS
jgi:hypothetical protein